MVNDWMVWANTALGVSFGWLWNQDRRNQNERMKEGSERMTAIEHRLNEHDMDRISRAEFNGVADSIRKEFHAEHHNIVKTMNDNNEAIRTEMRECNKSITDRIDRLIERMGEK